RQDGCSGGPSRIPTTFWAWAAQRATTIFGRLSVGWPGSIIQMSQTLATMTGSETSGRRWKSWGLRKAGLDGPGRAKPKVLTALIPGLIRLRSPGSKKPEGVGRSRSVRESKRGGGRSRGNSKRKRRPRRPGLQPRKTHSSPKSSR
ncbi:unnamed protein product, partial [Effrenium voratum]